MLKNWRFPLLLIGSVALGSAAGWLLGEKAACVKFMGDIFLNLLFAAVVPLIFFSLSSAVAAADDIRRLGRIAGWMLAVFVMTGLIASILMIAAVKWFNPAEGISIQMTPPPQTETQTIGQQIVNALTVPDFQHLLSRKAMLAMIVFSILTGLASHAAGDKGKPFRAFLISGAEVMAAMIRLIMLYAPIGLGAYFAYLVGTFGAQLLGSYAKAVGLYYPVALLYFAVGFSIYALLAAGKKGLARFWMHIWPAAITAWGTSSSLAALPVNLEAAKRIGVPKDIREIVLPLGATIHMDGSALAAILKIAILFALFGKDFAGIEVYGKAIGVAILAGTVMSGIPGGGFLGEMLIVTLYGFPPEALPIISMLGAFVDPPATIVNSSGDTVAAMLVSRRLQGKRWLDTPQTD